MNSSCERTCTVRGPYRTTEVGISQTSSHCNSFQNKQTAKPLNTVADTTRTHNDCVVPYVLQVRCDKNLDEKSNLISTRKQAKLRP